MAGTVWDEVLGRIETKVNRFSYYTWFQQTSLASDDGRTITVRVADPSAVDWLAKHYSGIIQEALAEVGREGTRLRLQPDGGPATPDEAGASGGDARPGADGPPHDPGPDRSDDPVDLSGLSPRYSFDTFIVGGSNQFAHAACRAVAEAPSRSYNPLFLYGGVGLGKTHLMHAIGHYVLRHSVGLKLTYISAERFMNEVVNAIRYDRILEFRERYRSVDVLLVDDIQFIVGKERTQTEFFHTFNALHDAQKQIVLSSDCPPHQISELEERLRSRFEWGLIADHPTPRSRDEDRDSDAEGPKPRVCTCPMTCRCTSPVGCKSNIRELEGSLIRLLAYASLTGRDLSMNLAQEVLRDVLRHEERVVTIDAIQKFVAEYYHLRLTELKSSNNSKSIALPRQVAMYLCKSLTNASLPEIGKSFGGKHHSTVIHSIKKIEEMRQRDSAFNTNIHTLIESFR